MDYVKIILYLILFVLVVLMLTRLLWSSSVCAFPHVSTTKESFVNVNDILPQADLDGQMSEVYSVGKIGSGHEFQMDVLNELANVFNASRLATYEDLVDAYRNGAQWGIVGWTMHDGRSVYAQYPMQDHDPKFGGPGVITNHRQAHRIEPHYNLYGPKPSEDEVPLGYVVLPFFADERGSAWSQFELQDQIPNREVFLVSKEGVDNGHIDDDLGDQYVNDFRQAGHLVRRATFAHATQAAQEGAESGYSGWTISNKIALLSGGEVHLNRGESQGYLLYGQKPQHVPGYQIHPYRYSDDPRVPHQFSKYDV